MLIFYTAEQCVWPVRGANCKQLEALYQKRLQKLPNTTRKGKQNETMKTKWKKYAGS